MPSRIRIVDKPPWRGTRGHWTRAFASAVLLRSYADSEVRTYVLGNYNEAMIQLIESFRRLDAGFEAETMAALAWFIVHAETADRWNEIDHNERAFAGIGILSFAANLGSMVSHDTVMKLSDWLIAEEERACDESGRGGSNFPHHWLFRTNPFEVKREKWMAIGAELGGVQRHRPMWRCRARYWAKAVRADPDAVNCAAAEFPAGQHADLVRWTAEGKQRTPYEQQLPQGCRRGLKRFWNAVGEVALVMLGAYGRIQVYRGCAEKQGYS